MAKKNKKPPEETKKQVMGFVGVGLDSEDGHTRVTNADHFLLVGGSTETHGRMQDVTIYFNEQLKKRGKPLQDTEAEEALDLLREAMDK